MSDPREVFLNGLDFNQIEVREYPKIAFLCGGSPIVLFNPDTHEQYFPSVRSYISQLLSVNYSGVRFQNAEDVKDWNSYSAYEDLIEFEKDIAHLCKAIVLFVESPGSIAELGSFAIIPEITEKLIVFVHTDHSNSPSFVSLGPLKRINDSRSERIHYITWGYKKGIANGKTIEVIDPETLKEWGKYTCDHIQSFLETKNQIDHSQERYTRTKEALFIHDIICLFKAVNADEIKEYLKLVSHEVQKKQVGRSLFCLEKLGLIRPVNRGNKTYFVPEDLTASRYLSLPVGLDSARLAMQLDEYYKHHSQLARREAIQEAVRGRQ